MKNILQKLKIGKHVARYSSLFDPRTYETFKSVIESFLFLSKPVQADMAEKAEKSLSAIQYFFQSAKWCANKLNEARLSVLRNKPETRDRETDMLVLDGSSLVKDKDTVSEFVSKVWDNRSKQVKNGYELFGAGIVTQEGHYYALHAMIFVEFWYKSLYNGWISFLKRCLKKTKAWLVIIDRGFKNQYFLQAILQAGRQFLIRIDDDMLVMLEDIVQVKKDGMKKGKKKKFPGRVSVKINQQILKQKGVIEIKMNDGIIYVIPNVIIKAWAAQIPTESTVVVYKRNKFKNPLVLCFSQGDVDRTKALELIQCYYRRWKIEQIFKEEKQLFVLEDIKVRSVKALHRYIHMIMVAHTLLFIKQLQVESIELLKGFIEFYLKKTRKIPKLTLCSLKIFLEKCTFFNFDFKSHYAPFYAVFYSFNS